MMMMSRFALDGIVGSFRVQDIYYSFLLQYSVADAVVGYAGLQLVGEFVLATGAHCGHKIGKKYGLVITEMLRHLIEMCGKDHEVPWMPQQAFYHGTCAFAGIVYVSSLEELIHQHEVRPGLQQA